MRFNQIQYKPTQADKDIVSYVLQRKYEMDTLYREKSVRLAKWARDDYEGTSNDRVANMDLLQIPLSYPAVNQRCSILFNNQSKAEYRTVDESKKYDVEILKKVDEYDKKVGKYNADYQDIEMTANIEGSCFFRVNWEEHFDDQGNTVDVPSIIQKRIRINDFWWDQGARTVDEMNHGMERKVMTYERYLRMFSPLDGKGFKNVRAVQPMAREYCEDNIWREEWEEYGNGQVQGKYVTLWYFETLGMIEGGKIRPRAVIIANGIPIYDSEKLFVPCKPGKSQKLSWSKIDGIPSGTMIGMGIPVLIRHPQEAFNRLLTLSVAQAEIAVVPPVILGPQIDWDIDDYPLQAGTTIRTRGSGADVSNAYHWFQTPDITQGAQKMMEDLIQYVIMLTGVDIRALFVPASEKAITTVNKREIQEKLLRFSVQWNEDHGYYDLAVLRLRFLQYYYPKLRTFLVEANDQIVRKEAYLQVPVKNYETEEMLVKGQKKIKLNFKEGGYTKIDITPENIDFNVDVVIEGATTGQERDAIEKKNFLEGLQILNTIPAFQNMVNENGTKFIDYLLKESNIPKDEIIEEPKKNNQNMHPAFKEITAITMFPALGMKFPEDVPSDILEPDKYDPSEYVDIFSETLKSDRYKTMKRDAQNMFQERFTYHQKNANNPYFFEMKEKEDEEKQAQEVPENSALPEGMPAVGQKPEDLMGQVRAEGAQIANLTK